MTSKRTMTGENWEFDGKTVTELVPLWDELFPAEQARIVRLLVERVDLSAQDMQVRLRAEGVQTLVEELRSRKAKVA